MVNLALIPHPQQNTGLGYTRINCGHQYRGTFSGIIPWNFLQSMAFQGDTRDIPAIHVRIPHITAVTPLILNLVAYLYYSVRIPGMAFRAGRFPIPTFNGRDIHILPTPA